MDYIKIKDKKTDKVYILAEARLAQLYPKMASDKFKPEQKVRPPTHSI